MGHKQCLKLNTTKRKLTAVNFLYHNALSEKNQRIKNTTPDNGDGIFGITYPKLETAGRTIVPIVGTSWAIS